MWVQIPSQVPKSFDESRVGSTPTTRTILTRCAECSEVFYSPIKDLQFCSEHKDFELIEHEK